MRAQPGRTLRRIRAAAWRAVRGHYALGFTAVALLVAAAIGSGAFERAASGPANPVAKSTLAPFPDYQPPTTLPPRSVTFILVATEREKDVLQIARSQVVGREFLAASQIFVVLVRNAEEQATLSAQINDAMARPGVTQVDVVDLRQP